MGIWWPAMWTIPKIEETIGQRSILIPQCNLHASTIFEKKNWCWSGSCVFLRVFFPSSKFQEKLGKEWHESYGYGSIPINTIFSGMNIHLPAILMFTRGTRFWHTAILNHEFSRFWAEFWAIFSSNTPRWNWWCWRWIWIARCLESPMVNLWHFLEIKVTWLFFLKPGDLIKTWILIEMVNIFWWFSQAKKNMFGSGEIIWDKKRIRYDFQCGAFAS